MFEKIKFYWNINLFDSYNDKLNSVLTSISDMQEIREGDEERISNLFKLSIKSGKRALGLSKAIKEVPAGDIKVIEESLSDVEKRYELFKSTMARADNSIQQIRKKLYTPLKSMADEAVNMYEVVIRRLDDPPKMLRKIYIENESSPEELKEIIGQYINGKLSKEKAVKKLSEKKARLEKIATSFE